MGEILDQVMSEIKNETNMIDEKIYKVSEMDNDTLHWIDDTLNNIMTRKKLRWNTFDGISTEKTSE